MGWILIGTIALVFLFIFLGLYFWSSGARVIADQEKYDIRNKTTTELADELKEIEKEDKAEYIKEEDQFYSQG